MTDGVGGGGEARITLFKVRTYARRQEPLRASNINSSPSSQKVCLVQAVLIKSSSRIISRIRQLSPGKREIIAAVLRLVTTQAIMNNV